MQSVGRLHSGGPYASVLLVGDGLIGQLPELDGVREIGQERKNLNHEDADHLFLRINPEACARRAAPVVFAFRADGARLFWPKGKRFIGAYPLGVWLSLEYHQLERLCGNFSG